MKCAFLIQSICTLGAVAFLSMSVSVTSQSTVLLSEKLAQNTRELNLLKKKVGYLEDWKNEIDVQNDKIGRDIDRMIEKMRNSKAP